MSVRFGLLWPFRNPDFARVPWAELYRDHLQLIAESEALGYDHAWLSEHHFVDDGYSPSLFTIGGAIAARTSRLRIGTFVLLLPLHNPVEVAENTATLDLISDGRFDLGVAQGYRIAEFDNQGLPRNNRGARIEESLEIVRRLLSGETVTLDGKFTKLRDLRSPRRRCSSRIRRSGWAGSRRSRSSASRGWASTSSAAAMPTRRSRTPRR